MCYHQQWHSLFESWNLEDIIKRKLYNFNFQRGKNITRVKRNLTIFLSGWNWFSSCSDNSPALKLISCHGDNLVIIMWLFSMKLHTKRHRDVCAFGRNRQKMTRSPFSLVVPWKYRIETDWMTHKVNHFNIVQSENTGNHSSANRK